MESTHKVQPETHDQDYVQRDSSQQGPNQQTSDTPSAMDPLPKGRQAIGSIEPPKGEPRVHFDSASVEFMSSSKSRPPSSKENRSGESTHENAKPTTTMSSPLRSRPNQPPIDLSSYDVADSPQRSPIRRKLSVEYPRMRRLIDFDELDDEYVPPEEEDVPQQPQTFSHPISALTAHVRAERPSRLVETRQQIQTAATSSLSSATISRASSLDSTTQFGLNSDYNSIHLANLDKKRKQLAHCKYDDEETKTKRFSGQLGRFAAAAKRLVREHRSDNPNLLVQVPADESTLLSAQSSAVEGNGEMCLRPSGESNIGILGSLLKVPTLRNRKSAAGKRPLSGPSITPYSRDRDISGDSTRTIRGPAAQAESGVSPDVSRIPSEVDTPPRSANNLSLPKWHKKSSGHGSASSLTNLIKSSMWNPRHQKDWSQNLNLTTPPRTKQRSGGIFGTYSRESADSSSDVLSTTIEIHIENVLERQDILLRLCKMMLKYRFPTYDIERLMSKSARILQIDGKFLYIPDYMLVSFSDPSTHTSEVRVVDSSSDDYHLQRIDALNVILENLIRAKFSVKQAGERLIQLEEQKDLYSLWIRILCWGLASAFVGPWAFQAHWLDMPIIFLLGCMGGIGYQLPKSKDSMFRPIAEMTFAFVATFVARWLGSYEGNIFCFSAITKSSLSIILPGFNLLTGIMEIHSHNIVAGSSRMVWAIMYSLFLGYGIMIGTTLYGSMDPHATSSISCPSPPVTSIPATVPFVAIFTACMVVINRGTFKQMPGMVFIAVAGSVINQYVTVHTTRPIGFTVAAFTIGILGRIFVQIVGGTFASITLPALWVQVPSGLAANGSLIIGVFTADLVDSGNASFTIANATGLAPLANNKMDIDLTVFEVAFTMFQCTIGLSIGLLLSNLFRGVIRWCFRYRKWKRKNVFSF